MRPIPYKHLALAGVLAVAGTVSTVIAEERVKFPQPVDSLLYPNHPATDEGRASEVKRTAPAASQKQETRNAPKATAVPAKTNGKAGTKTGLKAKSALGDTTRPIGTPGSPTTQGVKGTGIKKPVKK